jgi:hypothetical protein
MARTLYDLAAADDKRRFALIDIHGFFCQGAAAMREPPARAALRASLYRPRYRPQPRD